jgi:hypothetical protein
MSNKNNIETNNENNADTSREQALQILRNLYGYTELPSEKNANDLYWNTVLKQANITPAQYEEFKSKYVKRNSVGIIEAISASAANNLYVPLARVAVSDTASYYQVLDTDFTYFTDVIVTDDLTLPQNGTFFIRPNQADAHLQYGNQYIVYFVNDNKIYRMPNYQTLEVELVERKLTYDSIQILENPYVDAIINKFKVTDWTNRYNPPTGRNDWRPSFPSIAVYRPFPPSVYLLQTSHDRLYEGQQLLVRLITQRVPPGRKFKYSIEGVDAADIDIPLNGILETAGGEASAGVLLRINTRRDKRTDGAKTLVFNVDIPYDQTYGGGQRLEAAVDILERSTTPQYLVGPAIITRQTNTPAVELRSRNGQYGFVYQSDGNLVVYDAQSNAIRGYGYGSQYFQLQNDGNWVVFNANGTINFAIGTATNGPVYFVMQDDGNLVLYRMFDELPIWSSFGGRNANHNPQGTENVSILKAYANLLSAYATSNTNTQNTALNNVRNGYNLLPQATKDAFARNTGATKLAFVSPFAAGFSKISAAQQATALNEFIGGNELRRDALTYSGNRTFQVYRDALITASTEINVADIPAPPGRFVIADTPGFNVRGIGSTTPVSEAPRGQGAESGLGAAAAGGVAGGASGTGTGGTSTPPPATKPTNPAISLISTNSTSKIESVRITHPTPTSEIKIGIGTGTPNTNYTKGSSLNIPPGQQLRARAIVNGVSSDIVTRINQNTPPPNPPPPGGGARTGASGPL